ncbi:MAG: hypothetical protein DRO88_09160 [Promethearchaeia archaeon]|nr:MAG: hypothetical protein DRO88_09160 [Candidatus Lokiarchaeia archaeon]
MSNPKKNLTSQIEIREIELIIDISDIMVKEFVAGRWTNEDIFTGFNYSYNLPIEGVRAFQKGKIPIESHLSKSHREIEVRFSRPFQKDETYAYELHLLLDVQQIIQRFGSLNIIEWPKQDLTRIIFLPRVGRIFFSSILAQIAVDLKTHYKIITPGPFSRSIISHSRKSSAIRIE